jgi:cytochrome P450
MATQRDAAAKGRRDVAANREVASMFDAGVPSHVPPELVFDFDFGGDAELQREPHAKALSLHGEAPEIFFTPRYGGQWMVRSLEAARAVSQSPKLFQSRGQGMAQIPIGLDAPEHDYFRNVLLAAFAPKVILPLRASITELTNQLIDAVIDKGECEFMDAVASRLPVWVFMQFAGLPLDQHEYLRGLTMQFLREADPQKREPVQAEVLEATAKVIRARQAVPQDDMISRLIHSEFNGRKITFDEMQAICLFFVLAGLDTVTSALGFGFHYLARDPDLQRRMRSEPDLLDSAAEELLRVGAPSSVARYAAEDLEFRGVRFKQGDRVHILYPAANVDPEHFQDPRAVNLDQEEPNVAFGTGPHRCLGSHLARLEMRILYVEWLRRIPQFRVNPDKPVVYHAGLVWGVDELHLKWAP